MHLRWLQAKPVMFLAAVTTVIAMSGCQSYRPEPLDLDSYHESWKAFSPTNDNIIAFAESIFASQPSYREMVFDPSDGLSLSEGEIVSLVFNPDLRVLRMRSGIAQATAENAGRWSDPTFNLNVLKITESIPDPWFVSSALSFTIPISGRLRAEKARAEAALQTQLDRVVEMEWRVRRDLRDAWVSWSAKRLKLEQAQAIIEQLNLIVESTSLLSKAGEMPETEASLFLIEREARKAERNQLEAGVAEDFQRLKALVGLSPDAPIDPVPSVSSVPGPNEKEVPDNNNPTLSRLRSQYETAERALITEVRKQYPDLTIGPQAESEEGQSRIGFIGMIPIPILNANRQGIAEANAARETARVVFETEYQRILGRIAQLRARLKGIHDQLRTIQDNLAPLVDRQVTNAHRLLRIGESNSLVLLQSLIRTYEVKIMLIDLQLENSLTNNEIRFLLGPTAAHSDPAS